jgi:hypothetical protein
MVQDFHCIHQIDLQTPGYPRSTVEARAKMEAFLPVPAENSEISKKSRVLRITALMSPICLSLSDLSSLCSPADSVVGHLWN